MTRFAQSIVLAIALIGTATFAASAEPATHFFTIGGGYSPTGNQASLERNIIFFRKMLADLGMGDAPQHTLFADGDNPGRDLQIKDPKEAAPEANRLLAALLGSTKGIDNNYHNHHLKNIDGVSSPKNIDDWFNNTGKQLGPDQRAFIYFTGHGGRTDNKKTQNTSIMLWNNQKLRVKDFTQRLDRLDKDTPVVLLMVQCFAGGFANVIFKDGDPNKGLADANRCGFFATVHDRTAAGCTPDINEAGYEDYSTHFLAALLGETRTGETVPSADYDGDGVVSFAEAHAYSLIVSDSIDISIKTSDALLRKYSTTSDKLKDRTLLDACKPTDDYPKLIERASACERATLDGLSERLNLTGDDRTRQVASRIKDVENKKKENRKQRGAMLGKFKIHKGKLANELKKRYPELANPFHPYVQRLLASDSDSARFVAEIKSIPDYKELDKVSKLIKANDTEHTDLDADWVKLKRFQYVSESIALAANLAQVADEKILAHYKALVEAEHGTLKQ